MPMMRPIGSTLSSSLAYKKRTHESKVNDDSQTKADITNTIAQSNNDVYRDTDLSYRTLRRVKSDDCNLDRNHFRQGHQQIQHQDPNAQLQDHQPSTASSISDTVTASTTVAVKSRFSRFWDRCKQVVPSASLGDSTPRAIGLETLASPSIQPDRPCSPLGTATVASPEDVNIGYSEFNLMAFESWENGFSATLHHKRRPRFRHSSLVVEKTPPSMTSVDSLASTSAPASISSESLTSGHQAEGSSNPNNSTSSASQDDSIVSGNAGSCRSSIASSESKTQRQTAMLNVRRSILEGREELEQYMVQVQKLELDRVGLIGSQSRKRQERDVLESEIEALERSIRDQSRGEEADSSLGLDTEHCCPASSSIGIFVPNDDSSVSHSTSTHAATSSLRAISCSSGIPTLSPTLSTKSGSSLSLFLPFSLSSPTVVTTVTTTTGSLPSQPPPPQQPQPKSASSSMFICARCHQRALLLEKRTLLSQVHREREKVQRKINYMASDTKHLKRTFIMPIESCLAKDRDEWTRLLSDHTKS